MEGGLAVRVGRRAGGTQAIVSHHDFSGVPADLADRVRAMRATGAGRVKVAVTAARLRDCLTIGDAMRGRAGDIAIAMGDAGRLTRLLPERFGSRWTYAGTAAPGQFTAAELRHVYRVDRVTPTTRVFGIAGAPLAHSASPAMHNAAFDACGLDAVYVPLETRDADELLEVADAFGLEGVSVTAPLKSALLERCRPAGSPARSAPSTHSDGPTPAGRDRTSTPRRFSRRSRRGASASRARGGRARRRRRRTRRRLGACHQRRKGRASAREMPSVAGAGRCDRRGHRDLAAERTWDVLVNATPIGTWPHVDESPLPAHLLVGPVVYDLVYNPAETRLLREAQRAARWRLAASTCSWRRRSVSASGGRAKRLTSLCCRPRHRVGSIGITCDLGFVICDAGRELDVMRWGLRRGAWGLMRMYEADNVRRIRRPRPARARSCRSARRSSPTC